MTYDESLANAIESARELAAETGENCYILHSPIYANTYHEYEEIEHVVGIRAAFATLYRNWQVPDYKSKLVGVASPDGQVFLNQIEDILARAFGRSNDHTEWSAASDTHTLVMPFASTATKERARGSRRAAKRNRKRS